MGVAALPRDWDRTKAGRVSARDPLLFSTSSPSMTLNLQNHDYVRSRGLFSKVLLRIAPNLALSVLYHLVWRTFLIKCILSNRKQILTILFFVIKSLNI